MNYMQCKHGETHWRLKSWAFKLGNKQSQGFSWVRQCITCGCECDY